MRITEIFALGGDCGYGDYGKGHNGYGKGYGHGYGHGGYGGYDKGYYYGGYRHGHYKYHRRGLLGLIHL